MNLLMRTQSIFDKILKLKIMKQKIQKISFLLFGAFMSTGAWSQCPTVTCPTDLIVYSDSASCGATLTYALPQGVDACSLVSDTLNFTGTIDSWIVPAGVTSITIEARGAAGASSTASAISGGLGAIMIGDFAVTPGQSLSVLVGQSYTATDGNGGGGGSFVVDDLNNPLIIAGGGGGSGADNDTPDKHGQAATNGGTGSGGGGTGGTAGNGGNIGASFASGAGGGFFTDGADGWSPGSGGQAYLNGGAGANIGYGVGGFGGGGNGSSNVVGGGGGGYSGGGSGSNSIGSGGVGGGGGSYNVGTNQVNTGGVNIGNGLIIISYGGATTTTLEAGIGSGNVFPVGTSTEYFSVVNEFGDSAFCSFTVTVVDTIAPMIIAPSNVATCDSVVTGIAASSSDNCTGETISYTLTGATTGSGSGDASGTVFQVGTTTVWYYATDASGNQDSSSFDVVIYPIPSVMLDAFSSDTVCVYFDPIALPTGSPASGVYSGNGVSGTNFDPSIAGNGAHWVTYTYTDSMGCSNADSSMIIVDGCLSLNELSGNIFTVYPNPVQDQFVIATNALQEAKFHLYDATGRIVLEGVLVGETTVVSLSQLVSGTYVLEIDGFETKKSVLKL